MSSGIPNISKDFDLSRLPNATNGKRWTIGLKDDVLTSIEKGGLTFAALTAKCPDITPEELLDWGVRLRAHGRKGLRVSQKYAHGFNPTNN